MLFRKTTNKAQSKCNKIPMSMLFKLKANGAMARMILYYQQNAILSIKTVDSAILKSSLLNACTIVEMEIVHKHKFVLLVS